MTEVQVLTLRIWGGRGRPRSRVEPSGPVGSVGYPFLKSANASTIASRIIALSLE
jgi:hypothetical protein